MTAITLMATALQRELFDRGVKAFPLHDCEAIIKAVLERAASAANAARAEHDNRRDGGEC